MITIRVPGDLPFSSLRLTRDPVTGDIGFEGEVLRKICEDNEIQFTEDTVSAILTAWYAYHRARGGAPDQVMEIIIAEVDAEAITGIEITTGGRVQ